MKIAYVLGTLGMAAAGVGLLASDAEAFAHARTTILSANAIQMFVDSGASENARGRIDKAALTITAELNAGQVSAIARLVTSGGALVGNCTVTDPAPVNGTGTSKVCNTLVGASFLDTTVD